MDVTTLAVAELLPHDPPMVLIDKALSYDENSLVAEVVIRPDSAFCGANGVPGWVGIEYMAQAIAAHAGARGRLQGESPVIGYLLGTRSYTCSLAAFPVGATLLVHVEALFVEMALGAFACRIETAGFGGETTIVAEATINVYQPDRDDPKNGNSGKIS